MVGAPQLLCTHTAVIQPAQGALSLPHCHVAAGYTALKTVASMESIAGKTAVKVM